jgi:hypothetical protein
VRAHQHAKNARIPLSEVLELARVEAAGRGYAVEAPLDPPTARHASVPPCVTGMHDPRNIAIPVHPDSLHHALARNHSARATFDQLRIVEIHGGSCRTRPTLVDRRAFGVSSTGGLRWGHMAAREASRHPVKAQAPKDVSAFSTRRGTSSTRP